MAGVGIKPSKAADACFFKGQDAKKELRENLAAWNDAAALASHFNLDIERYRDA
jgi:hypothetical protein